MFSLRLISLTIVVLCLALIWPILFDTLHPDAGLTIVEMVPKYGYPLETHSVETPDGYILQLHRIPYGIKGNRTKANNRTPVLLMHGLLTSSADWVILGPEKSLAYLLADAGFDVWMGNFRGNTWSRKHKSLDPDKDSAQFYNFTLHELGILDVPATIDHVLKTTANENLFYVGFSQGCTSFFIMNSERPQYNKKIRAMFGLAPAVFMKHTTSIGFLMPAYYPTIFNFMMRSVGMTHELCPNSKLSRAIGIHVCGHHFLSSLCTLALKLTGGSSPPSQMDHSLLPVLLTNNPSGAATKQLVHYSQSILSGDFAQFDFSSIGNVAKYGRKTPPSYDLNKVTAPVTLIYSRADTVSSYRDVENLAGKLPNLVGSKVVPLSLFSHVDFLSAIDIVDLLNGGIVTELDKLNSRSS